MALASSRRPSANGVPSALLWLTPYASWVPTRLGTSLKAGRMGIWSKVSRVGRREGKVKKEGKDEDRKGGDVNSPAWTPYREPP